MFRAVVHERTLDIWHQPDERKVKYEYDEPRAALYHRHDRDIIVVRPVLYSPPDEPWRGDKQSEREYNAEYHGDSR